MAVPVFILKKLVCVGGGGWMWVREGGGVGVARRNPGSGQQILNAPKGRGSFKIYDYKTE